MDAWVNDREIEIEANVWETTLKPYELRSFTMDAGIDINNFNLVIPTEIIQLLETQSTDVYTLLERTQAMGYFIPGMEKLREKLRWLMNTNICLVATGINLLYCAPLSRIGRFQNLSGLCKNQ